VDFVTVGLERARANEYRRRAYFLQYAYTDYLFFDAGRMQLISENVRCTTVIYCDDNFIAYLRYDTIRDAILTCACRVNETAYLLDGWPG